MAVNFGTTLFIANPAAQSGRAAAAAERVMANYAALPPERGTFELRFTEKPHDARVFAAAAAEYDTVIAVSGDGMAHDVANGLMQIPADVRPAFGVLPCGTGNDYARSLGFSLDLDTAANQMLSATSRLVDLGKCGSEYFIETLSFGADADIAVTATRLRNEEGRSGASVFFKAGIEVLWNRLDAHGFTAELRGCPPGPGVAADGTRTLSGDMYMFAAQVGPYYGGGFKVCPEARNDDGYFDLCVVYPPFSRRRALYVFTKAKRGKHAGRKGVEFARAKELTLRFTNQTPAQVDGEPFFAEDYSLEIVPKALRVLVP